MFPTSNCDRTFALHTLPGHTWNSHLYKCILYTGTHQFHTLVQHGRKGKNVEYKCQSVTAHCVCFFGDCVCVCVLVLFSYINSIGWILILSQKRHKWPWCNINHNVHIFPALSERVPTLTFSTKPISFLISINSSWLMRPNVNRATSISPSLLSSTFRMYSLEANKYNVYGQYGFAK